MQVGQLIGSLELRDRRLSYFVGSLAIVAAAGHALILVFALAAGVIPLAMVNVGSIALYIGLSVLNRRGHQTVVLALTILEVLAHAMIATAMLGWDSAFYLYILCLVPLIFYIDRWPLVWRGSAAAAVLVTYEALAILTDRGFFDTMTWDTGLVAVARYGNMAIAGGVLIALSFFYQAAVSRAEKHMESYSRTLEELSLTDPLTGVRNRRGSQIELQRAVAASVRAGAAASVLLIDIDHFKRVNDTHGHDAGDAILIAVARAASGVLRGADTFGRWGGEEFLAVLPGAPRGGATVVAERIHEAIGRVSLSWGEDAQICVTATVGGAVYDAVVPARDVDIREIAGALVTAADAALYRGKMDGRDRVVFASGSEMAVGEGRVVAPVAELDAVPDHEPAL